MTFIVRSNVVCDVCTYPSYAARTADMDKLRAEIAAHGWSFDRATQRDLCPVHTQEAKNA